MEHFNITVHNGYHVKAKTEKLGLTRASQRLLTKRQRRYTCAERIEDTAVLTRHLIVCPQCGSETPAYARFLGKNTPPDPKIACTRIEDWGSPQLSFYEVVPSKLELNTVVLPKSFRCPRCAHRSSRSTHTVSVELNCSGAEISLTSSNANIGILFYLPEETNTVSGRLTETLTFDTERGTASLRVTSGSSVLAEEDVTCASDLWHHSTLRGTLTASAILRRKLLRAFSDRISGPVPALVYKPELFFTLNAFRGYQQSFYDSIPYDVYTGSIPQSFHPMAQLLHQADDIPSLMASSGLPQTKSIRKIMFANPALFFYLPELEKLWSLIGNCDLFRRLLSIKGLYTRLSFLHHFPGAFAFLTDFGQVSGSRRLVDVIMGGWGYLRMAALGYSALSESAREAEKQRWRLHQEPIAWLDSPYSVPMNTECPIPDCTVCGFSFTLLRTLHDYHAVGSVLSNCLREWRPEQNPVIAVQDKSDGTIVAAIEIGQGRIVQARANHNEPLYTVYGLEDAVSHWAKKNGFTYPVPPEFGDDFDDVDGLDF